MAYPPIDPEDRAFLVETNLPTQSHGRVVTFTVYPMVSRRSCHAKAQAVAGPSLQLGQTIPEPLRIAENVVMDQYLYIPFLVG